MSKKERNSPKQPEKPPSREELIQRILAALEAAPYVALYKMAVYLE